MLEMITGAVILLVGTIIGGALVMMGYTEEKKVSYKAE